MNTFHAVARVGEIAARFRTALGDRFWTAVFSALRIAVVEARAGTARDAGVIRRGARGEFAFEIEVLRAMCAESPFSGDVCARPDGAGEIPGRRYRLCG